jgi:hypothetical protein
MGSYVDVHGRGNRGASRRCYLYDVGGQMKTIALKWNRNKEEGEIDVSDQFRSEHMVWQIDALDDWIYELIKLRESISETAP